MTPEQFTYWLQGYAEINGAPPSEQQWAVILDHLKLVFDKRTPDRGAQPDPIPYAPTPLPNPPEFAPQPNWPFSAPLKPLRAECKLSPDVTGAVR